MPSLADKGVTGHDAGGTGNIQWFLIISFKDKTNRTEEILKLNISVQEMTATSNTSLPCANAKMKPYDIAIAMDQVMTV